MPVKKCSVCKEEKQLDGFHKNKGTSNGYHNYCKQCRSKYRKSKKWESDNRDRKEYHKKYYILNKEKYKEISKTYNKSFSLYKTFNNKIDYCEDTRKDPYNKKLLQVKCSYNKCNKWFNPTNREVLHRIQSLNGNQNGEMNFYCSNECKQKCNVYGKSIRTLIKIDEIKSGVRITIREDQSQLRQMILSTRKHQCEICGSNDKLIIHHIEPVKCNPIESLDIDNIIILCPICEKRAHSSIGCRYIDLALAGGTQIASQI